MIKWKQGTRKRSLLIWW